MIRTGWVRVNTNHPEVSVQVMTLGPGGQWSLYQPHGNATLWRFDDEDHEIDTLIGVIDRLQTEDEITIETVWHENGVPIIQYQFEAYYAEVKFISARECVMGTVLPAAPSSG